MAEEKTILILAANPRDTQRLRLDREMRQIRRALERARERHRFALHERQAVTPRDLSQALLDLRPQIVHFCGHGVGTGGISLEDPSGRGESKLVGPEAIAGLFSLFSSNVECVVFNSCYSDLQAVPVSRHIRSVVGMRERVQDQTAIDFAEGFYDALGAGEPIERAFEFGKSAIELQLTGVQDHLKPVLLHNASIPVPPPPTRREGPPGLDHPEPPDTGYEVLGRMSRQEIEAVLRWYKKAVADDEDDSDHHLGLGLVYLQLKLFDLAQRSFQRSFELAPGSAEAHYYYALSLIRGRRPRSLGLQEVKTIEAHVSAAIELDERLSKYYYLLAILRYDFYRGNGLSVPDPDEAELLRVAARRNYDRWEVERLLAALILRDAALVARIRRA